MKNYPPAITKIIRSVLFDANRISYVPKPIARLAGSSATENQELTVRIASPPRRGSILMDSNVFMDPRQNAMFTCLENCLREHDFELLCPEDQERELRGLFNREDSDVTPSQNLDPLRMRESNPAAGREGFFDEEAT